MTEDDASKLKLIAARVQRRSAPLLGLLFLVTTIAQLVAFPFTFETDYTSEFVIDGPFTVNTGSGSNLELTFAAGSWFHNGSRWLDPRKATNRLQILRGLRRNVAGGLDIL